MDDTTQVEWSFVGIESPYCQGRHSTERTAIYAYNSRPTLLLYNGIRHAFDRAGQTLYAAPVPNARRGRYQLTRPQHSKA